ncbi:MAG TPA: recombination mediator RecR [Thermoanaerobaculales bacterium]|nr:recombination mediator RecR [Thermoanaerobaculales bacterium]HQL28603.1 recombination mediator RecR [Thermoanaerobaculales bacterium]
MELRPRAVRRLLEQLERLPGIGPRTARALVEHLLTVDAGEVAELAESLAALRREVRLCEQCFLLTEEERCPVCLDPGRDRSTILVVEEPTTAWAVEATREYRGLYHALLGHLSPLHGVGPEDLTIDRLEERCRGGEVREVILATNPTVEGETTALYIVRRLQPLGLTVSRPASGIPVGGELSAVDQLTLAQALQLRRKV